MALIVVAAGCAAERSSKTAEPTHLTEAQLARANALNPLLESSETVVVVSKRARTLELYQHGVLQRQYPIVLGSRPQGRKRFEGDMRTPEGLYHVQGKRLHDRWRYFIAIDYPNAEDRDHYRRELDDGAVPEITNKILGIGGGIGIHGSDHPNAQERGEDWTQGCVAMRNRDLTQIFENVRVGTPVLMLP